jgi:hypothetical protein
LPDGLVTSPNFSSRALVLVLVLVLVLGVRFDTAFAALAGLAAGFRGFAFNAKRGATFAAPRFFIFGCAVGFADFFAPAFPPTRLAYCNAPFTIT